jgi:glycosyltransferase involved in cell wall biosynthesis
MYSLIIPVYRNEASIPDLLQVVKDLDADLGGHLEVVFVVDGSPDRSAALLHQDLPGVGVDAQLIVLSRNFGAFSAVRAGLAEARGPYFAVMAADLQEPPDLVVRFFRTLEAEPVDVVLGHREGRDDPAPSRWAAQLFWALYRRFVQPEMPPGGVDVFALEESNSTLVGLLLWIGFRRKLVAYRRRPRRHGRSAWSLGRRIRYLMDSVFAFSDLPIRLLVFVGAAGLVLSGMLSVIVLFARLTGAIDVPGYAATVLVISFFAALNSFGLGVIGAYVWRAFENTKRRPHAAVMSRTRFGKESG